MIFVSVGTSQYPYPRLVRAIDSIAKDLNEEVIVQAGSTLDVYHPKHVEAIDYLSRSAYERHVEMARIFVTHGGTGSIITALRYRTPVVIVPRRGGKGEHADDMMVEIADGWSERANIEVANDVSRLRKLLTDTSPTRPTYDSPDSALPQAVQEALPASGTNPIVFCPTPPGGHLTQLLQLTEEIDGYSFRYLTWQADITGDIPGVELVRGYHTESLPEWSTIRNIVHTTVQTIRLIATHRPVAVLSVGGGAFVISVALLAKLQGARVIHVESMTRFENASTTGRLLYPVSDRFFVQHPDVLTEYGEKAEYRGRVF